jgi:hypothetical protein
LRSPKYLSPLRWVARQTAQPHGGSGYSTMGSTATKLAMVAAVSVRGFEAVTAIRQLSAMLARVSGATGFRRFPQTKSALGPKPRRVAS